ncbi:hypothetical protein Pla52o_58180 [Novipirellula galeiformis]|uniref:Uncharacterized protein n=1 Tax=Novipirellula galeiformis TaxID=2528004 RepID=A0A5C6BF51_9BACT|nr:hypothetical protein Pla52o_58180 [Novipirellula galeiformis]
MPLLVAGIYYLRGQQPLPDKTQLWWIPAITGQLNLVVIVSAFSALTPIRRIAFFVFGTSYVVSLSFVSRALLYESWSLSFTTKTQHVANVLPGMLMSVLVCFTLVISSRLIFGVWARNHKKSRGEKIGIADLLIATLIVAAAIAVYQSYISTWVETDIRQHNERLKAMPHRIFGYSMRAGCCIGITLLALSRRHCIAGLALFASAIVLNPTLHATFMPSQIALFPIYSWSIVGCTLFAMRCAGYALRPRLEFTKADNQNQ